MLADSSNKKTDYFIVEGNIYTHKQVEIRNGARYMRMKKRLLSINEK